MRHNIWLEEELAKIWSRYFPDIKKLNQVHIKFGRRARTRLGSIKSMPDGSSLIQINGLLISEEIPDFIIKATIAHELAHYCHGFSSPHEQKYDHPHKGGIVSGEMTHRGLEDILILQKRWLKENWRQFIKIHYLQKNYVKKRRKKRIFFIFR